MTQEKKKLLFAVLSAALFASVAPYILLWYVLSSDGAKRAFKTARRSWKKKRG